MKLMELITKVCLSITCSNNQKKMKYIMVTVSPAAATDGLNGLQVILVNLCCTRKAHDMEALRGFRSQVKIQPQLSVYLAFDS